MRRMKCRRGKQDKDLGNKPMRQVLLGLAHMGAGQLGWDETTRRDHQERLTGKASCRDMSDHELLDWCWRLKRLGAMIGIPLPPRIGGATWDRPTERQLGEIEQLSLQMGWEGLEDKRLAAFVARTAKVDDIRFMLRWQAVHVISGLRRWQRQQQQASKSAGRAL